MSTPAPAAAVEIPHHDESERAVLGAALVENANLQDLAEIITAADFYRPLHARIYAAMLDLARAGRPVDVVTLGETLDHEPMLIANGGMVYLSRLMDGVPKLINARHYAQTVRERAERRRLIEALSAIVTEATIGDASPDDLVADAQRRLAAVSTRKAAGWTPLKTILESVLDGLESREKGNADCVPSGLDDLDALLGGGYQRGDLVVVGARPSMGKTSKAMHTAAHAAQRGHVVGLFSLEMSAVALAKRLLFQQAGISQESARTGRLNEHEWQRATSAFKRIADATLYTDESKGVHATHLPARIEQLRREAGKVDLVIVDYLGLMKSGERHGEKVHEIGAIARLCKTAAHQCNVPLLLLCQLNRKVEDRTDKRPTLADLRDSGETEEHADVVMLLHRPEYYLKRDNKHIPEDVAGLCELIVAKHRNGPVDTVRVLFDESKTRFRNRARPSQESAADHKSRAAGDDDRAGW